MDNNQFSYIREDELIDDLQLNGLSLELWIYVQGQE